MARKARGQLGTLFFGPPTADSWRTFTEGVLAAYRILNAAFPVEQKERTP
jgi:hypothetical protein